MSVVFLALVLAGAPASTGSSTVGADAARGAALPARELEPHSGRRPDNEPAGRQVAGVIAVPRGEASLGQDGEWKAAQSGLLLSPGDRLETGSDGWLELHLVSGVRLRLSAATKVELTEEGWSLGSGRVWVVAPRGGRPLPVAFDATTPRTEASIGAGTSAVLESSRRGLRISVRQGRVTFDGGVVEAGQQYAADGVPDALDVEPTRPRSPRSGGAGTTDLAAAEARRNLGDLVGIEAFLLAKNRKTRIGGLEVRGSSDLVAVDPERMGSDAVPFGSVRERSLRPAPFFAEEVPPKGPNVEVEVEFGE